MLSEIKGLAVVVALLLTVFPVYAEVVPEVTLSGGYTDNLFNNSSSTDDTYTAVSPLLKIYPSAVTEITLSGAYTTYYNYSDLSNLFGSIGVSVIPDVKGSSFHYMFLGGINGRSYGEQFEAYNNWGGNFQALFSYVTGKGVIFRGGGSASFSEYTNSIIGDNDGLNFLLGLNATLFGSNSFNFEAGYGFRRYVTDSEIVESGPGPHSVSRIEEVRNTFQEANFSVRYSRPLGIRTGVSAFYSHEYFVKEADWVVYGFSIDYLSPLASMWDGPSIGAKVKHFPGSDFVVETGFAYTDKEYVQSLDLVVVEEEPEDPEDPDATTVDYVINQRNDERTSIYVQVQRPFSFKSRMMIRPSLQIRWIDNQSTDPRYDYSYPDVQVVVYMRF